MKHRLDSSRPPPLVLVALLATMSIRCGGGRPVYPDPDAGFGSISGIVVKGRVAGATVTAYRLDAGGGRRSALATATTDATGAFTLYDIRAYFGPILLVATGGTYPEEAVANASVRLESQELTFLLDNYVAASTVEGLAITPVSHLAAGLALHWVQAEGMSIRDSNEEAWTRLNNHFGGLLGGGLDWRKVSPADFTVASAGQLDGAGKAGLILAGLSMEARTIAERAGVTPGASLSALSLVEALYEDVTADGFFDGQGYAGALVLPSGGFVADAGPTAYVLNSDTARLALGQAIERFIRSDRNATTLTLTDALPLIEQLTSNSDARIFRTAGGSYDYSPPTLQLTVRWSRSDGVERAPQGALNLVGGTLTVTASASDQSAIWDMSISVDGVPITVAVSGPIHSRAAVGSYVTSADGPLSIRATAIDVHGNSGSEPYNVVVDNTPPAISVSSGSPSPNASYSDLVPVDASASDMNGLRSFVQSGLAGFTNLSGIVGRITGSWPTAGRPDGLVMMTLTALDTAFNSTTLEVPFNIDRTPPTVALVSPQPPRYTNATSLTLHVTAQDTGAGVAAVKASVNGGPEVAASLSGTTWDVPVDLGLEGNKTILVWAVDAAQTGNSSFSRPVTLLVTRDATKPAPVVVTNVGAYIDERPTTTVGSTTTPGMGLLTNTSGSPVVPPVYTFPSSASKVAVHGGMAVFKAATRLSWGATPPSVDDLFQQDGVNKNVPFVIYEVPASNSEAPISPSATFSVTCPLCSSFPDATGALLRDVAFGPDPQQRQRFLLPLTVETIPGLAGMQSHAQLKLTVQITDGAGNAGGQTFSLDFHVVGPPLVWRDATSAYTTMGDPSSAFAYRTGTSRNYDQLFNASNPAFGTAKNVRLVRYVVENAAPVPVALTVDLASATYQQNEAWNDSIQDVTADQATPSVLRSYVFDFCTSTWPTGAPPCGDPPPTRTGYWLYSGYQPTSHCNRPLSVPGTGVTTNPVGAVANSSIAATAYLNPQPDGRETVAALTLSGTTAFSVPAASGSTPGRIVVYLTRPATAARTVPIRQADVMAATTSPIGTNAYSYTMEDFWQQSASGVCTTTYGASRRHGRYLVSAETSASGLVAFSSFGITAGATLLGESSPIVGARSFTVSFRH